MLENALQILEIVKGTFSELSYDIAGSRSNCTFPQSDAEALNCEWLEVSRSLNSPGPVDNHEVLRVLTKVGGRTVLHLPYGKLRRNSFPNMPKVL